MFEIEERGLVFDAAGQSISARTACFTSLCRLRCGELLCSFQLGSGKHSVDSRIGICRSSDDGRTWAWEEHAWQTTLDGLPGSLAAGELIEVARIGCCYSRRGLIAATRSDHCSTHRLRAFCIPDNCWRNRRMEGGHGADGENWICMGSVAVR
ncbi:MAG UNVERIFIED_CONTAM: hypothetical protein LVR18_30955 [Planctomycetaceae bacterium]|jgi:hypothetical protein